MPSPDDELRAELKWLSHNQSALDARLGRVEDSVIFRSLRAIGAFYQRRVQKSPENTARAYGEWRALRRKYILNPDPTWRYQPIISLVLEGRSEPLMNSIRAQTYARWEAISDVKEATGDYVGTLGGDEVLVSDALARAVEAMQREKPDWIYFDHEIRDLRGLPLRPVFKPDWSPVLLASCDYLGPFVLKSFRASGQPESVAHIPEVLYATTRDGGPIHCAPAPPAAAKPGVSIIICTRNAELLSRCLTELKEKTSYPEYELVVVQHTGSTEDAALERVISEACAVRAAYAEPFNFSAMNNRGARASSKEVLLFLNDDVTARSPEWLTNMVARLQQPGTGAVGAKLLYPNGTIQHAGIATWVIDGAGHPGRNMTQSELWPWLGCTREVTAVTGACLCVRRSDFEAAGGFDEQFPVNFNDVDLCLRLREAGLAVIFESTAELTHEESRTRERGVHFEERRRLFLRWHAITGKVDPFYSTFLAQNNEDLSLRLVR